MKNHHFQASFSPFSCRTYVKIPNIPITDPRAAARDIDSYFIDIDDEDRMKSIHYTFEEEYNEGAIVLTYKKDTKETLLDAQYWDDVDDLWTLLVQLVRVCYESKAGTVWFPDQPIRIDLTEISEKAVRLTIQERSWALPRLPFYRTILEGARHFFERAEYYTPGFRDFCIQDLSAIDKAWADILG